MHPIAVVPVEDVAAAEGVARRYDRIVFAKRHAVERVGEVLPEEFLRLRGVLRFLREVEHIE